MRSLKIERKARNNPRAKTLRHAARAAREMSGVQPGSARRRKKSGWLGGITARIGVLLARPILALGAGLVLLALIAALLVSGMAGRAAHGVGNAVSGAVADAGFGVYEIRITGNRRVPTSTIFAALGLKPGQSIFFIDLPGARARIMALDWIASADVVRRYPDTVTVAVVEKRPFALWQTPDDQVAVVERAGGIITTQGVENFAKLPKLVGVGAPEAASDLVDAAMTHRAVSARIAAYERISKRRWNLILNDGVVVKLPETGWLKELDALERLIVDNGILERDVTEIDLRSPTQYFFVLKSGEKKDVQRGKET
ncbi:MAG TPA: FtsQ-type POTRA domain-containing protein [Rhizomicrobium sp.]|nr:FtsQ-type POTRA domain-containing protein [Rhizomicrobium sp.]